jgi:undecaprenyl-diphosphatase
MHFRLMSHPPGAEQAQQRVERVLEQSLERVDTLEAARAVVARVERLSAGETEAAGARVAAQRAAALDERPVAVARTVARVAAQPAPPERAVADALHVVAEQAVAPTPTAEPVLEGARAALTPTAPVSPRAQRGRQLLKAAILRRMGPLSALDARIYLAVNEAPHPGLFDTLGWALALITTGGWIWVIGTLLAYLIRVKCSWVAVKRLLPSVVIATWLIEYPIKAFFRRRRPFARIVEALVIGKKPGSWSFPSGHTGSSFASAWILSSVWPERAPLFFLLAATVGFSRVYVGAHYPGDVMSGAFFGMMLSELVRRAVRRLLG